MVRLIWENEQDKVLIKAELIDTLKSCIEETLKSEDFPFDTEISLTFTDNENIREQNLISRGIDRPTDVLSFPLLEQDDDGELIVYEEDMSENAVILGDILISAEKAVSQAEEYGHSVLREFCFLTVHSTLHLLGLDHERSDDEEKEMFEKQDKILEKLNITR